MWISKQTLTVFFWTSKPAQLGERISIESAPVLVFSENEAPAWMGRNEASLLRAAGEKTLASSPRGGSCAHPDQSRGLARRRHLRAISGVGASSALLLLFLGGGVALHERLVGTISSGDYLATFPFEVLPGVELI